MGDRRGKGNTLANLSVACCDKLGGKARRWPKPR
jgi:hypothetical protein